MDAADENNVVVDSISMEVPLTDQDGNQFKSEYPPEPDHHHHIHQQEAAGEVEVEDHQQQQELEHHQEQTFRQQQTYIFVCELCNDTFSQQLKFFEHLKAHYGSGTGGAGGEGMEESQDENLVEIQNEHVQTEFEVVASTTENDGDEIALSSTLTYSLDTSNKDIHMPLKKPEVQSVIKAVDESLKIAAAAAQSAAQATKTTALTAKVIFPCPKCKRTFRRVKTFQTHVENCRKGQLIEHDGENIVFETVTAKSKPKGKARGKGIKAQQLQKNKEIILEQIVEEVPSVDDHGHDVQAGLVHPVSSDTLPQQEQEEVMFEEGFMVETEAIEEEEDGEDEEDEEGELEDEDEEGCFGEDGLACVFCDEPFFSKARLNSHLKIYHAEELPLTSTTNATTESTSSTKAGVAASISNKKPKRVIGPKKPDVLKCTQCQRIFNHRNSLVYHMRSHTGERPHQCELCGKSFFATSALKVHMRLHSGEKPYKCESCGRHFRQWGDLKYHMISIHSDIKEYQCEFCGKDFARKYSLIVHRRIHTGERNYKCEYCQKCFRAASYLQNHRRIHTGEKPHSCSICGKPFRVRSDMKRHMASHNREHNHNHSNSTISIVNTSTIHQPQKSQQQTQAVPNVVTVSSVNSSNQQIITIGPQISQQLAQAVRNGTATIVASSPSTSTVVIPPSSSADGNTSASSELQQQQTQQITINDNELVITGDLGEGGTPINITLTPQEGLTASSLASGVAIQEGVIYQREGGTIETVTIRESNTGTLYVWPISFMN